MIISKKDRTKAWILIGIICVIGFYFLETNRRNRIATENEMLKSGRPIKSELIEIRGYRYGKRKRYGLLRYHYNGKPYRSLEKIWEFERDYDMEFAIGDSLPIKVEVNNPKNCVIDFEEFLVLQKEKRKKNLIVF